MSLQYVKSNTVEYTHRPTQRTHTCTHLLSLLGGFDGGEGGGWGLSLPFWSSGSLRPGSRDTLRTAHLKLYECMGLKEYKR
jgi:hypothetical protein